MAISGDCSGPSSVAEARKWRLFVGNLADTVKQEELKEKFELLLKGSRSNQEDVRVGNVEIRCKNQDNYFGFVDIHGCSDGGGQNAAGPPPHVYKVIELMNNTKWKGMLIKVQLAKESFLDKLKRERAGGVSNSNNSQPQSSSSLQSPYQSKDRNLPQPSVRKFTAPRKPDNFDFEIVSNAAVKTRKTFPGDGGGQDESDEEAEEDFHEEAGIPKFKGLGAFGFGKPQSQPSDTVDMLGSNSSPKKYLQQKSNSKPDEALLPISEEDQARFERFQRIAGYPTAAIGTLPGRKTETPSRNEPQKQNYFNQCRKQHQRFDDTNQEELEKVAGLDSPVNNTSPSATAIEAPKGVVFRKHKQQNSDLLRQQSLHKMKDLKTQQSNIIKSSLSQSNISNNFGNPATQNEALSNSGKMTKKPKMDDYLFGNDDEGEEGDVGHEFKLKKQYESSEGQKLLELRGKWGFDDRFNIDERFTNGSGDPEDAEGDDLPSNLEKQKQMNILSDVLGSSVTLRPKSFNNQKKMEQSYNSVLINRYDPDNDPNPISTTTPPHAQSVEDDPKKLKSLSKKSATPAVEPVLIRSNEPATYKTVSNLKSLFSSEDTNNSTDKTNSKEGGFSLLATFGGEAGNHENDEVDYFEQSKASNTSAPRQFWESNPFKYDSSDDEDAGDGNSLKKKKSKVSAVAAPAIPKCEFFFRKNDPRFAGLTDYFCKRDEMDARIDYDEKRRELRSIVKAKARNAKRKDEKRTVAIKRAIRKKRHYRKTLIKSGSSNAMKLGGGS